MCDVLIVGAGPAGAVAALGAGARRRARAPRRSRDVSARQAVRRHGQPGYARAAASGSASPATSTRAACASTACVVTGERGVAIDGRYPDGVHGRAIVRRDLDWLLLAGRRSRPAPVRAGRRRARRGRRSTSRRDARCAASRSARATGERARRRARDDRRRRPAVDDRASASASRGIPRVPAAGRSAPTTRTSQTGVRHPSDPASTPSTVSDPRDGMLGEMHVRRGRYIGVAPIPGGLTNVCLVRPSRPGDAELRDPAALLARELARDPLLRDRAADARLVGPPVVLGPLAVDVDRDAAIDGLLARRRRRRLHRSDDRRRPALRRPRRRAGGGRGAARARARLAGRPRAAGRRAARASSRQVALQPRAARAGGLAARGRRGGARRARRAGRPARA